MTKESFYQLKIGQEIWYKNEKCIIKSLIDVNVYQIKNYRDIDLYFIDKDVTYLKTWEDICQDCSLTPPEPKEQWYMHEYWEKELQSYGSISGYTDYYIRKMIYSECKWENSKIRIPIKVDQEVEKPE